MQKMDTGSLAHLVRKGAKLGVVCAEKLGTCGLSEGREREASHNFHYWSVTA